MPVPTPTPPPAGELRILIGGSIDEVIGELITKVVEKYLGYARVSVRTIEPLRLFLETAARSPPDLFLLYLYFVTPADEVVADPATCRGEIHDRLAEAADQPCCVTSCDLRLVTYLRAEFNKPVIVLTGCGDAPGRATTVEQAGGSAFLTLPFAIPDCVAAIGSCVERGSDASK